MNRSIVQTDSLSQIFSALANPTRRAILNRLKLGQASVTELAEPFNISQPAVTKHLKVLEKTGLIKRSQEAQTIYSKLDANALKEASEWLEGYKQFWIDKFDRLERFVEEIEEEGNNDE